MTPTPSATAACTIDGTPAPPRVPRVVVLVGASAPGGPVALDRLLVNIRPSRRPIGPLPVTGLENASGTDAFSLSPASSSSSRNAPSAPRRGRWRVGSRSIGALDGGTRTCLGRIVPKHAGG